MDLTERAGIAFRNLDDLRLLFVPGEDLELQDLRLQAINKFVSRYKQAKDCREELQKLHTDLDNSPSILPSLFASFPYVDDVEEKLQVLGQLMEDGHWKATMPKQDRPGLSESARAKCLERDGARCLITKTRNPLACHIYPHASIPYVREARKLTPVLFKVWGIRFFPGVWNIMRWDNLDNPVNMISLDCRIRRQLENFRVALEPVADKSTPTKLVLRYRRLFDSMLRPRRSITTDDPYAVERSRDPRVKLRPYDNGGMELNRDPRLELRKWPREESGIGTGLDACIYDEETGQEIRDGFEFTVETDDPVERPLPDISIMRMAYMMALMITLSGSGDRDEKMADKENDEYDDSSSKLQRLYAILQSYTPTPRVLLPPPHPGLSISVQDLDEKLQVLKRFVPDGHWEWGDWRTNIETRFVSRFAWADLMPDPVESFREKLDGDETVETMG
ncbi:hypothetical protein CSOJ01_01898 [Colletotrichum sojae]|uniref:HNH nuclease domain-containing protein n=1 Tax=Colletotrichum sojae TaxID=2175907 RepID=A0A8H6JSG2_9PEZI|nr:hypothetical protein CSOJ01_01898 [Colletotrichum sojae]